MIHHTQDSECPDCENKLLTAHPYLGTWFRRVKIMHPDVHISWAWRGKDDQNQCVKDGASKALWPTGPHNAMRDGKPCSKALDLFQQDENGKGRWDGVFFARLDAENQANNEPLKWGGNFKDLGDGCHMQLTDEKWAT